MSYWVENGTKELEGWENRLMGFLTERLSPEQITYYLDEFQRDVRGFHERAENDELPACVHNAIPALSQIRSLLGELKQTPPEIVPIEIAARFAVLSFRAGIFLGLTLPAYEVETQKLVRERAEMDHKEELDNAQKRARKESSVNARKARWIEKFKEAVGEAGEALWLNGSKLLHHKLADHLLSEYVREDGVRLLELVPENPKWNPRQVAIKELKRVAKRISRSDLIYDTSKKF